MLKKIIVMLLSLVIIGGVSLTIIKNKPETDKIDPLTYFDEFKGSQMNMVYEDTRVEWEVPVIEKEGMLYIECEWASMFLDDHIFYDKQEQVLTITNLQQVIRVNLVSNETTVNNKPSKSVIPINQEGDKFYIAESYIEENYAFNIEKGKDERLVVASYMGESKQSGKVNTRKAQLRTKPHKKALIVEEVEKGHELTIYGLVENGYLRVRSENGMIGYIAEKQIKIEGNTSVKQNKVYESKPIAKPLNDQVKLVWDQMTVRTAGDWQGKKYTQIQGANVISPTWFEFADGEGNLIDRGHSDYVSAAKARDLQVWALMSHNFTKPQYTKEILTSTKKRQHVINQLVDFANKYNLDGINIDIENIQPDFSREWLQFMRELYPQMQEVGATVSVDIYMPSAWSKHYERAKVSEVVDYFIVMGYDQHWSGSEEAGPTSGLRWVEEGIIANLQEVPKEKLVLGIPFFTRIWEEAPDGLKSKPYGMVAAARVVEGWGVTPIYDEEHMQHYAQVQKGDTLYRVWLEDASTIAKRIEMIENYDLAGYAGWKLGLEDSNVWNKLNTLK